MKRGPGKSGKTKSRNEYGMALEKEVESLKSSRGYLYAGLPRFKALFGRDSLITGWELLGWRDEIAKSTVSALADLQGRKINVKTGESPGKILHEYFDSYTDFVKRRSEIPWLTRDPSYFSVDSTPLFVIVSGLLGERNPDFISLKLMHAIVNALRFLVGDQGMSGLLTYVKAAVGQGLASQSWRDGIGDVLERLKSPVATVGAQGYFYDAMNRGLYLLDNYGTDDPYLETELKKCKSQFPDKIEDFFWIEEKSYYALATDGDGVAERAVTSDPGHLLFSGILSRKRERDVVDGMFDSDMLTDYGIRTLSVSDERFDAKAYQRGSVWPQDNWIIAQGLRIRGYSKEYGEIRDRLLHAYEEMGRMPEYFGVDRNGRLLPAEKMRIRPCYPQAWSTGAIINFVMERDGKWKGKAEVG